MTRPTRRCRRDGWWRVPRSGSGRRCGALVAPRSGRGPGAGTGRWRPRTGVGVPRASRWWRCGAAVVRRRRGRRRPVGR
ncbi:hypothetical protein FZI85_27790 [Mycobacterium sp. CBMA293]|nr:hypothetical protein [Mycolicibacterium sp. CBMA 360]MUL62408.1 hypothetical protein [Mycolicibacterium sp. CBMA 335]MUM14808.1 hypothetical protein [Mycolicibacterium sp. CBMA 293]